MVMRISENMKFDTVVSSLGNVQNQYNSLLEQMASQKKINRISDDPLGMTFLLGYRQGQASIDQYQKNIDSSNSWLSMTEAALSNAGNILTNVKELAIGQGTATATAATRLSAADNVQQLKEQLLSLANSTYGDRYLFAGSRMETAPFSANYQATATIDAPSINYSASTLPANRFDGTIDTVGSAYTGTANQTYLVKITSDAPLATAKYEISSDGGKTWGSETSDLSAPISLGNGITLNFHGNTKDLATGDMIRVDANAVGNYKGNGADLTIDIGKDASINYNITGEAAFTGGNGGVDVFKALDDLKTALTNNDQQGILAQLDNFSKASDQVNFSISKVGTAMNRLSVAKGNLQDLSQQLTTLTSNTEDADITQLATSQAKMQLILQASYSMAAKLGSNSILDFIK